MIPAGLLHFFYIFVEVRLQHVPIVPIITNHRIVLGKTDLSQANFQSLGGEFRRFAGGMPAKRRVHMIICR